MDIFKHHRNSRMEMEEVYFWTTTVKDWKQLLKPDKYKTILIDLLADLVQKEQMAVYGFVIMPNHAHILLELLNMNGKEKPHASFQKASSHAIVKDLKLNHPQVLAHFSVAEPDRQYRIWQANPLAIRMDTKMKASQKLDYIHNNPLQERWNLAKRPEEYAWSSAAFYQTNHSQFDFLTRYEERFG